MKDSYPRLKGCDNFRDLGGLPTIDGREVKKGLLYRSDCLHKLSRENQNYLLSLNIREVIDFRGPYEVRKKKDKLPPSIKYINASIDAAGKDREEQIKQYLLGKTHLDLSEYMRNTYKDVIKLGTPAYREWFSRLLKGKGEYALLFHCTAGKDRTGLAAAFLLDILGVEPSHILQDYLKTNELTAEKIRRIVKKINCLSLFRMKGEKLVPLLGVEESFLQTAWDYIEKEWGSKENYYREELKIGPEECRALERIYLSRSTKTVPQ